MSSASQDPRPAIPLAAAGIGYSQHIEAGAVTVLRLVLLGGIISVSLTLVQLFAYPFILFARGGGASALANWLGLTLLFQFLAACVFVPLAAAALALRPWSRAPLIAAAIALAVAQLPMTASYAFQFVAGPARGGSTQWFVIVYMVRTVAGGLSSMVLPTLIAIMLTREPVRRLFGEP